MATTGGLGAFSPPPLPQEEVRRPPPRAWTTLRRVMRMLLEVGFSGDIPFGTEGRLMAARSLPCGRT
jgi:hypothetical protein